MCMTDCESEAQQRPVERSSFWSTFLNKRLHEGNSHLALSHQRSAIERIQGGAEGRHIPLQTVEQELGGVFRQLKTTAQRPLLQGRDLLRIRKRLQLEHGAPG